MSSYNTSDQLHEGEKYHVTRDDVHLTKDVPNGPSSWKSETVPLQKGDVITYVGKKPGLGHDNVDQDAFETEDGEQGKFSRQFWGKADRDALAPIN